MLSKQQAVKEIAEKLAQIRVLLSAANRVSEEAGLEDLQFEDREAIDEEGVLYDLEGWNSSSC